MFFAYGIVTQKESFLFVDSSRFAEGVNEHLEEAGVQILAYKDFLPFLGSNVKRLCDGEQQCRLRTGDLRWLSS